MSKNRKLGVPHFPAAEGRLLRGSSFVGPSADLRTFWGPLQRRDDRWFYVDLNPDTHAYLGYHYDPNSYYYDPAVGGTIHHVWEYSKPLAWRPEHSLLVPPQVVHLCVNVFMAYSDVDLRAADLRFGADENADNPDVWPYVTRFDVATAEQVRLVAACRSAAATINAIRPGKTWVQVIDYQEGSVDNGGLEYPFDIDFPDNRHANVRNQPFELLADHTVGTPFLSLPSPFVLPFYGTDFLQVYLGDQVFQPVFYGFDEIYPTYFDLPVWRFMSDVLARTVPSFHRYSVRLYPSDVGTAPYMDADKKYTDAVAFLNSLPPVPTLPYSTTYADSPLFFQGNAIDMQDYPGNVLVYYWVDPLGGAVIIPPEAAAVHAATILPSLSVFSLVSQWSDANGFDVGLGGAASGMDATSIVAAVAAHFGFDPDTGRDLG